MTCLENGSFVVAAGIQTCSDQNCDRRRKTENGAKSNAAGWLGSRLSRQFLFPEGRTYSPPPKCAAFWRWWYPDRVVPTQSGRALCEADFVLCGERRTMRAELLSSVQLSVLSLTAHPGIVRDAAVHCAARHLLFAKPVTGRFSEIAGRGFASGQLFREKVRIATAPLEPRNDEYEREMKMMKGSVRTVWQFTTWK